MLAILLARGPAVPVRRDAARASAMGRPGSLAGWINSPPKAAPCSRRVWPHASIALAGLPGSHAGPRRRRFRPLPILSLVFVCVIPAAVNGRLRVIFGARRCPPIGPPSTPLMGPPRGPLIPPLMGPPGGGGLGEGRHRPVALVRWLSGAGSRAKSARDPAPLRYVGVPPTCRLGRTLALDEGIEVETRKPAPVGR